MRHPLARRSRRRTVFTIVTLALAVVAAAAFVFAARISAIPQNFTPVSLGDTLDRYRADPTPRREDLGDPPSSALQPTAGVEGFTRPTAGVYTYATTGGKEWLEQRGEAITRTFPSTTYATVLRGAGCVWEIWFQSAKEYSDSHRQCSAPGVYLCVAHMQDVELAGFRETMSHSCRPNMLMVGGRSATAGGTEETVCYAGGHDMAKITIVNVGKETVDVGGQPRRVYHTKIYSDIYGELIGQALAEVWLDVETGMYLKLIRSVDVKVQLAGEPADYHVRATYQLKSLTPQT